MNSPIKFFFIFVTVFALFGCNNNDSSIELKQKIDKYVEYWNTANFNGIEELLCEDFELLESPIFEPKKGIETFKQTVLSYHKAYPDFKLTLNEGIFETDKAAGIWTITATNTGEGKYPPTGKHVEVIGLGIVHFKDGKIKDEWIAGNDLLWLEQLGYKLLPPARDESPK